MCYKRLLPSFHHTPHNSSCLRICSCNVPEITTGCSMQNRCYNHNSASRFLTWCHQGAEAQPDVCSLLHGNGRPDSLFAVAAISPSAPAQWELILSLPRSFIALPCYTRCLALLFLRGEPGSGLGRSHSMADGWPPFDTFHSHGNDFKQDPPKPPKFATLPTDTGPNSHRFSEAVRQSYPFHLILVATYSNAPGRCCYTQAAMRGT